MIQRDLFAERIDVKDGRPVLNDLQRDVLTRGRAAYANGIRRVIWQASCGAGKTVVAAEQTIQALALGKTVLHIVHRRRLVDQMVKTLARFGIDASPVMEGRQRWDAKVKCASRDTLLAMLDAGAPLPAADLIIVDECHVASTRVMAWYLEHCPGAYWTGYTATPVATDGRSLAPPYEALVCMQPASALRAIGRLCPVKVFNPDHVGRRRRNGDKVKPVGDPVAHWRKYAEGQPTVVFAATVAASKQVAQHYLDAGITAEHLDASTDDDERDEIFSRSERGETKVICNCGVLIEGVDLPWLSCCQILRGCNSLVLWMQATGRVMRTHPGKTHGIVLDHAAAAHQFGLPDADYEWSLEDAKGNAKRNAPQGRKPVTCRRCGLQFMWRPACPDCGCVMAKPRKQSTPLQYAAGDGVLTEFTDAQTEHIAQDTNGRLWKRLLYMGRAKGWQMRQVAAAFRSKAKVAPWEAGLDCPLPFGKEGWSVPVSEWIERCQAEEAANQ